MLWCCLNAYRRKTSGPGHGQKIRMMKKCLVLRK